ncbi:RGS domain-containing serine/threonine-protein kinase A-like [Anopheles ziemanni]|uniref:RGS domain-containing serine/threonine-protein kinase A-like n=1 Tax=Anopheles ziemanni TaxID=345580 RepID=UPI00265F3DFC|nr:RGS domain-containing serine/threonine-protein kinase A-like [Anopheles ziemanni]
MERSQQYAGSSLRRRRRPVFLPRNIKQTKTQITLERPTDNSNPSDERNLLLATSSASNSKQLPNSSTGDSGNALPGNETPATNAPQPNKDGQSKESSNDKQLEEKPVPKNAVTSSNNNNKSISINNNSISNANSPFWDSAVSSKLSSPERLPSMNGADRDVIIEDTEQVKVNSSFKTSQVEGKNFTFFRRGSLRRSKKSHPAVTMRMNRKFQAFVDRWLEQHVSTTQQSSCEDWLLGKHPDLAKNLTTVVVRDKNITRTPYRPYNRYKVNSMEVSDGEDSELCRIEMN